MSEPVGDPGQVRSDTLLNRRTLELDALPLAGGEVTVGIVRSSAAWLMPTFASTGIVPRWRV